MALTCESSSHNGTASLVLRGAIYEDDAKILKQELVALVQDRPNHLVIDMAEVSFIGSSGIGKLLLCYKNLASLGGSIRLTRTPEFMATLFKELRLDQLFEIERN